MAKYISHLQLTETIGLTECKDGFWIHDKTRGMNLSLRAKSERDAFVQALTYYQKRLSEMEKVHSDLRSRVDLFVSQFVDIKEEE